MLLFSTDPHSIYTLLLVVTRDVEAETGSGGRAHILTEARKVCRFRFHIIQKNTANNVLDIILFHL